MQSHGSLKLSKTKINPVGGVKKLITYQKITIEKKYKLFNILLLLLDYNILLLMPKAKKDQVVSLTKVKPKTR